jgi:hypothetical protein
MHRLKAVYFQCDFFTNKMPKRAAQNRKRSLPRVPRPHTFLVTGESLVVVNTVGTTYTNSFINTQFGLTGAPTYTINTQMLTDVGTYNFRVVAVRIRWLPTGGRSSAIGFGQGAAVLALTETPPSTINPATIAEYASWTPFYMGRSGQWTWRPSVINDKLWQEGNASNTNPLQGVSFAGGGWCFVVSTSCIAVTSAVGTLVFTFSLEVQFPGMR